MSDARREGWSAIRRVGLGVWLGTGLFAADPTPVRVVGSDLLGEAATAALRTWAESAGRPVETEFVGSRPAMLRLQAGGADLAVVIDEPEAEALGARWTVVPLGYLTAMAVVPRTMAVDQLEVNQWAALFGAASAQATIRWGELGATGTAAGRPVGLHVVQSSAAGLATELLLRRVLPTPQLKVGVTVHPTTAAALDALTVDEGGLAVVPALPPGRTDLKVLWLAPAAGRVAFGPTPENVHAGDYPLRVGLRLVFERERASELLPWLRFWLSDELAKALETGGVVPVPAAARRQLALELEQTGE